MGSELLDRLESDKWSNWTWGTRLYEVWYFVGRIPAILLDLPIDWPPYRKPKLRALSKLEDTP